MKKLILAFSLTVVAALTLMSIPNTVAQTATTTPVPTAAATTPGSTVDGLLTVCADGAIVNFSGTLVSGFDIYFQLFSGATGSGTSLSSLRQVQADGAFTFNERVAFPSGTTIGAGESASAMVTVARESDSSSVDFDFVLTDTQDGCGASTQTGPTSVEVGGTSAGTTSGTTTTAARHILAPNGGVLNPNLQPEPEVVVGDRLSDHFRSTTPGLIFAECDAFPMALPGVVLDSDQITIFWSWFTRTDAQMEDHLAHAQYSVKLNQQPFPNVTRSDIERRDGNSWVFYSVNVGNLAPGHYEVEYRLTWDAVVNDGYDDYGPDTDNPMQANNCNFDIVQNPNVTGLAYSGMYLPMSVPAHAIEYDY